MSKSYLINHKKFARASSRQIGVSSCDVLAGIHGSENLLKEEEKNCIKKINK